MSINVRLDTKELDRITNQLNIREQAVISRIALEIERNAKPLAPYDTGALMNSIYTKTHKYDGFEKAAAAAQECNPDVQIVELPELDGHIFARVGPCVDYGIHQEYGTAGKNGAKKMEAHPFLTPAAQAVEQKFNNGDTWRELFEGVGR